MQFVDLQREVIHVRVFVECVYDSPRASFVRAFFFFSTLLNSYFELLDCETMF